MLDVNFSVKSFLAALEAGRVCLHPTDTLPGLTFDPRNPIATHKVVGIKQRSLSQSFIGLVPDLASALSYWRPLPERWHCFLGLAWPGPLSIVWHAGSRAPKSMLSQDGSICLRAPSFAESESWMVAVLKSVKYPMPTTSVNLSKEPALSSWDLAAAFAADNGIFVPQIPVNCSMAARMPSTILQIIDRDSYVIVRDGAVRQTQIQSWLDAV